MRSWGWSFCLLTEWLDVSDDEGVGGGIPGVETYRAMSFRMILDLILQDKSEYNTGQRVLLNEENNKNNSEILNLKSINQFWPMMIAAVKKNILIIFLGTLGFVMPIPVLRIYPIMQESYIMQIVKIELSQVTPTSCSGSNGLD